MPVKNVPGPSPAGVTRLPIALAGSLALSLSGCTEIAPTAQILPGPGKTFEQFTADQQACESSTDVQMKPYADRSTERQLGALALGTVLGAGLGAAIGGGNGAGIGAAAGAIGGTAVGADQGSSDIQRLQLMYDNYYTACMVTRGNRPPAPVVSQTVVVAPPAVVVQPAPYVVQPVPVVTQPQPYAVQPAAPATASPPWAGQ